MCTKKFFPEWSIQLFRINQKDIGSLEVKVYTDFWISHVKMVKKWRNTWKIHQMLFGGQNLSRRFGKFLLFEKSLPFQWNSCGWSSSFLAVAKLHFWLNGGFSVIWSNNQELSSITKDLLRSLRNEVHRKK